MNAVAIGSRLPVEHYTILSQCHYCGQTIFLNDEPREIPIKGSTHLCTECAAVDVRSSLSTPAREKALAMLRGMRAVGL